MRHRTRYHRRSIGVGTVFLLLVFLQTGASADRCSPVDQAGLFDGIVNVSEFSTVALNWLDGLCDAANAWCDGLDFDRKI